MANKLFWTCPFCGANLDFGERCDCLDSQEGRDRFIEDTTRKINRLHDEVMTMLGGKEKACC